MAGSQITDAGITQLALPELRGLILGRECRVTPKGLEGLSARCPNLLDVGFSGTRLGDADLSSLQQWRLHTLQLADTQITRGGLQAVGKITSLQQLFIQRSPSIDDEALRLLLGLDQLTTLHATGTSITDAGLESLAKLQNLTLLDVRQCKNITAEGVRKLQAALPKCRIESDFKDSTANSMTVVDTERELAHWLLSKPGMNLELRTQDNTTVKLSNGMELPKEGFTIFSIWWADTETVTDEALERIGKAQHLYTLVLGVPDKPISISANGWDALFSRTVSHTLSQLTCNHQCQGWLMRTIELSIGPPNWSC